LSCVIWGRHLALRDKQNVSIDVLVEWIDVIDRIKAEFGLAASSTYREINSLMAHSYYNYLFCPHVLFFSPRFTRAAICVRRPRFTRPSHLFAYRFQLHISKNWDEYFLVIN